MQKNGFKFFPIRQSQCLMRKTWLCWLAMEFLYQKLEQCCILHLIIIQKNKLQNGHTRLRLKDLRVLVSSALTWKMDNSMEVLQKWWLNFFILKITVNKFSKLLNKEIFECITDLVFGKHHRLNFVKATLRMLSTFCRLRNKRRPYVYILYLFQDL